MQFFLRAISRGYSDGLELVESIRRERSVHVFWRRVIDTVRRRSHVRYPLCSSGWCGFRL